MSVDRPVSSESSASAVVVTGATGIGAASCRRLMAAGRPVFVIALDGEEVGRLVDELRAAGGRAAGVAADLTDEDAAEHAFDRCVEEWGGLSGVLAVAGASGRDRGDGPVHEVPLPGWDATVRRNMTPMFLTVREAIRRMTEGGAIVVVTSVLASRPSSNFVTHAYAAAKSAAVGFVRSSAGHYAARGIRVNGIAPALVDTPMAERAAGDPDTISYVERKQPLSRGLLPPEAVADAAAFLLSDEARYITGQVIAVDGGWSVTEVG